MCLIANTLTVCLFLQSQTVCISQLNMSYLQVQCKPAGCISQVNGHITSKSITMRPACEERHSKLISPPMCFRDPRAQCTNYIFRATFFLSPKLLCYWSLEVVTQKFEVMESERSPGAVGLMQDVFFRVDSKVVECVVVAMEF